MNNSTTARIRSVTKGFHTADGRTIGLELEKDDGTTMEIALDADVQDDFISRLAELRMSVLCRMISEDQRLSIAAPDVATAIVCPNIKRDRILLLMVTLDRMPHIFALSAEKCDELRAQFSHVKKKLKNAPTQPLKN